MIALHLHVASTDVLVEPFCCKHDKQYFLFNLCVSAFSVRQGARHVSDWLRVLQQARTYRPLDEESACIVTGSSGSYNLSSGFSLRISFTLFMAALCSGNHTHDTLSLSSTHSGLMMAALFGMNGDS